MSNRVTTAQIENAHARYIRAADALGLDLIGKRGAAAPFTWDCALHHGSSTYGQAWRLTGDHPGIPGGHLGMTKREAFDTLANAASAFEAVGQALRVRQS